MTQRHNSGNNRQFSTKIVQLFMGIMALFYVILGFFVIYNKWLMVALEQNVAYGLGFLLILYGLYRGWRVYQVLKDLQQN